MKVKIVKVPKYEAYYFCKRLFFEMFGNACMSFADCLAESGWVGFPYYGDNNDEGPILLYFTHTKENLDYVYNHDYANTYKMKIIITDIENNLSADEIIDLTSLKDYYQIELSMKSFIDDLLK